MLHIKNLHAQFEDTKILKGVDFSVKPGEVHVILGPNGSGKSTLGRVLLGDPNYQKTEGSIAFNDLNFDALTPDARARAGFFLSFQSPPEIDGVTVKDLLLAAKKSIEPEFSSTFRFKKMLGKTLEDLRLGSDFMDREANKGFSGGERKKLEMASLLTLNPTCAFLDEIDSGVDIDTVLKIGETIREFLSDKSKSLILVSHSEKLLSEITPTHVHIFYSGRIIHSGGDEVISQVHEKGFDHFIPRADLTGFQVLN